MDHLPIHKKGIKIVENLKKQRGISMLDFLSDRFMLFVDLLKHVFKYAVIFFAILFVYKFLKSSIAKLREKYGQQRKD